VVGMFDLEKSQPPPNPLLDKEGEPITRTKFSSSQGDANIMRDCVKKGKVEAVLNEISCFY
jgi:hypothetical protein